MTDAQRIKEIQAIRALALELVQRTSRLEEESAPVSGPSPRKGKEKKIDPRLARRERLRAKKGFFPIN